MGKAEKGKTAPSAKSREKLNNATLFRPDTYQKFLSEVPKGRVITPASVSDKFKINAALARKALKDMHRQKLIAKSVSHHGLYLYTRTAEQVRLADEKAAAALKQEEAQAAKKAAAAAKGKAKDAAAAPAAGAKKADDKKADE